MMIWLWYWKTVENVDKKVNKEVIRAALADKITKALKGELNELMRGGGSDYADKEYDLADYDDTDYTFKQDKKMGDLSPFSSFQIMYLYIFN